MMTRRRSIVARIALLAVALLAAPAIAHAVTIVPGESAVTSDLFDVNQGGTVTAYSPMLTFGGFTSTPTGLIGGINPGFAEPGNAIFADGTTGDVSFIDFHTPAPIVLTSYNFSLATDGGNAPFRGITSFQLLAGSAPGSLSVIASATLNSDYPTAYGNNIITVSDTLNVANVQYFRLEVVRATAAGPRLIELDGFGQIVPEPSSLAALGLGLAGVGLARLRRRRGR